MYSSESAALVVVCAVLLTLASCFVALRFRARATTKAGFGADDFFILAALVRNFFASAVTDIHAHISQLVQYAAAAMAIFGAVAGGLGDSELGLATHPAESERYVKVYVQWGGCYDITLTLFTDFVCRANHFRGNYHHDQNIDSHSIPADFHHLLVPQCLLHHDGVDCCLVPCV